MPGEHDVETRPVKGGDMPNPLGIGKMAGYQFMNSQGIREHTGFQLVLVDREVNVISVNTTTPSRSGQYGLPETSMSVAIYAVV